MNSQQVSRTAQTQAPPAIFVDPPPAVGQCRVCGCSPAVDVTYYAHRGMILLMQFRRADGPFCRNCGLATFRKMTADTLLQGWWGLASLFITPVTLLVNAALWHKVAHLEEPHAGLAEHRHMPMDPGKPLFERLSTLVGVAIPIVFVLFILLAH